MNTTTDTSDSQVIDSNTSLLCRRALEETLRKGAQRMLQEAIEFEVAAYLEPNQQDRDEKGHRLVT